ncbi:MAG TPA: sigma 54-interacting transcriptional regulator [Nitrospira sp.]|nr:sigma 54-interacting transcriptional regulator [Nitrospira sp.]
MIAGRLAQLTATNEDLHKELVERKMEKSLFESEAGFRAVLNNSPNPIFLKDMEGRYQFVNKIFEETVRLSQEQIKGKKDEEIFPSEQAAALRANDLQVQQTGLAMTFEDVPLQGDGPHTSIVQEFPVRDEHGMIYGTAGIVIDISERKHAYEELKILKDKLAYEKQYLESEIRSELGFKEIIGHSQPLKVVLRQIEKVAPTDTTVLIQGETGTGKELIARAIHNLSKRRDKTFVKVNCATIPAGLMESELFGHQKGAFTGAIMQKVGRFELAHQGTVFLDEVGEIPPDLQVKLLRVLQEQEFERLGSTRTQHVDIRVLAATNRDLAEMVAEKQFRSDLYYRLDVFPIRVPALRQRSEDIPDLVRFFTKKYARQLNKPISRIADATMHALCSYTWPGNIRELENIIERCVILSAGETFDLDQPLTEFRADHETLRHATTLEEAERDLIRRTLIECRWVLSGPWGAAAKLGMKRTSLQYKMTKLGITRPQGKAKT